MATEDPRARDVELIERWLADLGWSQYRAERELGLSKPAFTRLRRGEVPLRRYMKLAMAAVHNDLPAFGE